VNGWRASMLWSYYRFVRSHNRIDADVSFEGYLERCREFHATAGDVRREQNASPGVAHIPEWAGSP